jgi:hypothetical protein
MNKKRFSIVHLCLMTLFSGAVFAGDHGWSDIVTIRGFATAAYQKTDQSNAVYNGELVDGGIYDDGSMMGTRYGLNINAVVNDKVSVYSQFIATRHEAYALELDWGFVNVNVNNNLDLRVGRIKYPGGLLSEYVAVSNAYPWIAPPQDMYSEHVGASQAVHESFSGMSLLAMHSSGDMTYSANLFTGEVAEELVNRKKFSGVTLEANWDDIIIVQAAVNSSVMQTDGAMPVMDDVKHDITQFGLKIDWNDVVVYSEFADVDMGDFKFGEAKTGYLTLGYRFGDWMPHITVSNLEKSQNANTGMMMLGAIIRPFEQTTTTLGLRWDVMGSTSVKFEISNIELDSIDDTVAGYGMFDGMPDDTKVTRYGIAIDTVF